MSYPRYLAALGICIVTAAVAAAAPMKALIVDGQNNHNWRQTTPHLKKLLEETKLFTVDLATTPGRGQDMSVFKPNFAAYDLVVSNYTGAAWPEETKEAFEKFVASGGGLVIYHAANNAFRDWKEYNEMIAIGGWGGRNETDGPYLYWRWREGKVKRSKYLGVMR